MLRRTISKWAGGFQAIGQYLGARRRLRRLGREQSQCDQAIDAAYRQLAAAALDARLGTELRAWGDVRRQQEALAAARSSQSQRQGELAAAEQQLQSRVATLAEQVATAETVSREATAAESSASGELRSARSAVRSAESEISGNRSRSQRLEAAAKSPQPPADLASQRSALAAALPQLQTALVDAQAAVAPLEQRVAKAEQVAREKAAALQQSKQAAKQERAKLEATVSAAKSAVSDAGSKVQEYERARADAMRDWGRELFEAPIHAGPLAELTPAIKAKRDDRARIEADSQQVRGHLSTVARPAFRTAAWTTAAVAVIVVGVILLTRFLGDSAYRWPAVAVQGTFDAKGGTLSHESGIKLEIPEGTFDTSTAVSAKTAPAPAQPVDAAELRGPVVDFAADPAPKGMFQKAITVSLPFRAKQGESLTAAYWTGTRWRPIGSWVDQKTGTVKFRTLGFSKYSVMVQSWYEWPEVVLDPYVEPHKREPILAPRGSVFRLKMIMKGESHGATVEGRVSARSTKPGAQVELAPDTEDRRVFDTTGKARVVSDTEGTVVMFLVHVPEDATLGEQDLTLTITPASGGGKTPEWPTRIFSALHVTNRRVFVVDIDGLRGDVFRKHLMNADPAERPANLARLFGVGQDASPMQLKPGLDVQRFKTGYLVENATTIFPSYTFAGHAAIFTGRQPGEYGFPGNEWFDRRPVNGEPQRYAFTGAFADEGLGGLIFGRSRAQDPFFSYWATARANNMLKGDTVYDTVVKPDIGLDLQNVVGFCMYFGKSRDMKNIWVGTWTQAIRYTGSDAAIEFDKEMVRAVRAAMGAWALMPDSPNGILDIPAHLTDIVAGVVNLFDNRLFHWQDRRQINRLGIVTLFFASLDHSSHTGTLRPASIPLLTSKEEAHSVFDVQRRVLLEEIDPMIGWLVEDLDELTYRNSLWVLVSDHGHSVVGGLVKPDLRDELWKDRRVEAQLIKRTTPLARGGSSEIEVPRQASISDFVLGYNGGAAHVYVCRATDKPWQELPFAQQVITTARDLRTFAMTDGQWKGKVDVVLLRLPPDLASVKDLGISDLPQYARMETWDPRAWPYYVWDPADGPNAPIVPLKEYLRRPGGVWEASGEARAAGTCAFYNHRYNWKLAEADFLEEALQGMNCDRAGDIVLLPNYPKYYFESSQVTLTEHGSLIRGDMECALGIAAPGINTDKDRRLEKLLIDSVDLGRKPKPGNRDVPAIITNYYKWRTTYEKPKPTEGPLDLEMSRVSADSMDTRLLVTSGELARLGQDPDRGVILRLYRAQSPKGPFDQIAQEYVVFDDFRKVDPTKDGLDGRLDGGKFRFHDRMEDMAVLERLKLTHAPSYYQVEQTAIDKQKRPYGLATRSKVAGPSGQVVLNIPLRKIEDGAFAAGGDWSYWLNFACVLALREQAFDLWNAHFIVTTDKGWKGHYWAAPTAAPTGVSVFFDRYWGAPSSVRVPMAPGKPFSVTIEADGQIPAAPGGVTASGTPVSATRTVTIKPSAEIAAQFARYIKDAGTLEDTLRELKQTLQALEKERQQLEQDLRNAANMERVDRDRKQRRFGFLGREIERINKVVMVRVETGWKMNYGRVAGDPALVPESARKLIDSYAVERKLRIAEAAAATDGDQARIDADLEMYDMNTAKEVHSGFSVVATSVYLAGDAQTLMAVRYAQVKIMLVDKRLISSAAGHLAALAGELAVLTGNRDLAAQTMAMGWQLRLSDDSAPRDAVLRDIKNGFKPLWWPPGRPWGAEDLPAFNSKAMEKFLTQTLPSSPNP